MIYVAFYLITTYIRGFDPYNRVHRDVCINANPFGVFLELDPTHSTPGLPYALRSLGFDPSLSLVKLYKEPLGTLMAYREIESKETIVDYFRNLYLSLHPFVPWSTFVFFPSFHFSSELAIMRWRIEVVEAQVGDSVSPVRRCAVRGCIYLVISNLY